MTTPQDVIAFWRAAGERKWFSHSASFDAEFKGKFLSAHEGAAAGQLDGWLQTADGALALVLLLDQFPRNAFRDTPRMFATDAKAMAVADRAIAAGFDLQTAEELRVFLYLPFEHSEDIRDQDRCVVLCTPLREDYLRFAKLHRDIISRFGRFPHRNAVLGRVSTPEEERFLAEGGFRG